MALNEAPFGTYADVTGVVDTTAAAEAAALGVTLLALIPDHTNLTDVPVHTDFARMHPDQAKILRDEIAALLAAVAAAPTS